ncbi:ABC transporter permease [Chloroflexi bacterium TSY]|nr:ABC transporter permease [Chloroflexi bacterium TSY]
MLKNLFANNRFLDLRWRYALRDLWTHKSRTLLVILSIAVGVFAFGTIAGAASTLSTELPANYQAIQPASAVLHTTPIDDEMVKSIRRMPEVAYAEGRHTAPVRYRNANLEGTGNEVEAWQDLRLFALEDYQDHHVDIVRPHQGPWPPPERTLLIERNSLALTEAQIGDTLLLETEKGDQRPLRIVGLVHDMNQPPAQITGIPYAYVERDTLEWLGLSRNFNEVHLRVAENQFDKAHITQVAQAATDKIEESGYSVFWTEVPDPGTHFAMEFLPTILLILGILGVLALILSGFLVINVITAMLTQQTRQIGVMKAIGARAEQITILYLRMVLLFGVCALFISIPIGAFCARLFARFVAGQLNFDIDQFQLSPMILLLELAVGLLVPLLAALYPILVAARLTVREAVQSQGLEPPPPGENPIGKRIQELMTALSLSFVQLSRPLRLSLRNTMRRRGRLIRTLIPLMLGGAIFMSVLSVRASLFRTLEEMLGDQGFDVQIQLDRAYRIQRLESLTLQIPGVQTVESWGLREGIPIRSDGSEGDSVRVYALPADTVIFEPDLVEGRWLEPNDSNGIVVSTGLLLDEPDIGLDRELTLKIGDEEDVWRVIGLNEVFQPPIAPPIVYMNLPHFWQVAGHHGQTDTIRLVTASHDAATLARVAQEAEARLQRAGIEIKSTRTATEDRDIFTERFNIVTILLMIMAFLLATVGSLGLMATMSINVLERKREIGVLRAIGASDRSVLRIFVVEGMIIGMLSWCGALLLSQPMSRLMSRQIGLNFAKLPLTYVFDMRAPLFWLIVVLLVSALASLIPARNAASLRVRETLAYE